MARIVWSAIGDRIFEVGIDRGVLYIDNIGVPWNGLVSISESPSGGEVVSYFVDGIKYLDRTQTEEFEATIEAYTYPKEFIACEGISPVKLGLFVTHQKKKSFGLSYRSKIGNDVSGVDYGYKIHLIYNVTTAPTERTYASMNNATDLDNFSWKIVAKAPTFADYRQTAHFIIDSREVPAELMKQLTDILYGSPAASPRLPAVDELIHLFTEFHSSIFDAEFLDDIYYATFDAGETTEVQTSTIDGGTP